MSGGRARHATDHRFPVDAGNELSSRPPGCRTRSRRPRARPCWCQRCSRWDVHFLEYFQDAYMRAALGTAAGKHQAHPGACGAVAEVTRRLDLRLRRTGEQAPSNRREEVWPESDARHRWNSWAKYHPIRPDSFNSAVREVGTNQYVTGRAGMKQPRARRGPSRRNSSATSD